jgi:hypothetical protein
MSRDGCFASSPSVADASNPANDRNPNTTPRNNAEKLVPCGTVKTDSVNRDPPGAFPAPSRTNTIAVTIRIRATVVHSTMSRTFVPRRAGSAASIRASASATPISTHGAHDGGCGQMRSDCSSPVPKIPAADAVVTA